MNILYVCIILTLIVILILKLNAERSFPLLVKRLLANVQISEKTFSYSQLEGLPEPVQGYFRRVLKEGQPYLDSSRITHGGWFRTDPKKPRMKIRGREYDCANPPGFVWEGITPSFSGIDSYVAGRGRLTIRLFSLFKIIDAAGPTYDEGELLRWLGNCTLLPTALLPNEYISWSPEDENSANLHLNYQGVSVGCRVRFNAQRELVQLESRRWMNEKRQEDWVGRCSRYREINGVLVPTRLQVGWKLKEGEFSYALFEIQTIEYNPSR